MKLTAVGILKWNGDSTPPVFLGVATDVSNFGYFQRGTVKEGILFIARTVAQRTAPGTRQTVKNDEYFVHVHVKDNGIAGIVVADKEYPTTAAFSVISKVLEEFLESAGDSWRSTGDADVFIANPTVDPAIIKYQDHRQADKIAKIQKDLDDTKVILHETIDSVLRRGEKLDVLVEKSNDLGMASQMFYKQARKTNSCCSYM